MALALWVLLKKSDKIAERRALRKMRREARAARRWLEK
jgi:hypothetical protein